MTVSLLTHLRVFHTSVCDSKSPQVGRTLLSILNDLNNAIVLIVSTRPLIAKSFSLFTKPLENVPSSPVTTGVTSPLLLLNSYEII